MTSVTLRCPTCGHTARRPLMLEPGSRGVRETPSEPALCPQGHGAMVRADGRRNDAQYARPMPGRFMRPLPLNFNHEFAQALRKDRKDLP